MGIRGGAGFSSGGSGDCVAMLLIFGDAVVGRGFYGDAVRGERVI